ncbi:MAG: MgtC/SapB family protein [Burkholderiales bacterium]|nr:MAG: MgtC/SapB family protein [Burkholderiales bacterium]
MNELDLSALTGLGLAFAAGLLIGLERGWHQRDLPEGHRVAGLRTFGLIGLLGGLGGLSVQSWGTAVLLTLLVLVGLLLLTGYVVTARMHAVMGLTTVMAALATFLIGAMAATGEWRMSSVVSVAVLALLQFKRPLHSVVGRLSEAEVNSGTQLLLISVVVLPVLPDRGFGPYAALNPYRLWWAVVLLASLSFVGFILIRWLGAKRGLTLTALLGGLASSTATTAALAKWARQTPAWRPLAAGGATLACSAMFARMAALVAITAPGLGAGPVLVFSSMAVAGAAFGAVLTLRSTGDALPSLDVGNPLKLSAALQFAAFLVGVMVAGRFLTDRLGDAGLIVAAAASGLVDVDAITLSIGRMVAEGSVARPTATLGLFVAAAVNQLTKLGLVASLDGKLLVWRLVPAYATMLAVGLSVALLQR